MRGVVLPSLFLEEREKMIQEDYLIGVNTGGGMCYVYAFETKEIRQSFIKGLAEGATYLTNVKREKMVKVA